jgi:hypothetical protein
MKKSIHVAGRQIGTRHAGGLIQGKLAGIATLLALTFAFAPPSAKTVFAETDANVGPKDSIYRAQLISPRAGQVLVPGKVVKVEWRAQFPNVDLQWCETEIRLSLDGGKTFTWITGERDPREPYFYWTVPNTPTNEAVLDIHFGCLGHYPETASLQTRSTFVIGELK